MGKYSFKPSGICPMRIDFEIDDDQRIHGVYFHGGCAGNSKGIAALVEGMNVEEAVSRLKGISCRNGTSCPDQLAKALSAHL